MTELEYRSAHGEIREVNDGDKTFSLRVVTYDVVDSYGSVWAPDVFTRSLEQKMPSAAWAHDWSRIIGSLKEYDLQPDGVDGLVKFADFDHVPDARMAWSLLKDKHVKDTSFGFKRQDWQDARSDSTYKASRTGEKEIIRVARLDEVSPVLVGAVPGSKTYAVRSEGRITRMDAGQLLVQVAAGSMSLRDALNALEGQRDAEEKIESPADMAKEKAMQKTPHAFKASPEDPKVCEVCDLPEANPIHGKRADGLDDLQVMHPDDVDIALGLMRMDNLRVTAGTVKNPGGTAKLMEYWSHGEGAVKINWGTPGDHTRCVALLGKYVPPNEVHGLCTNIQKLAIGHAGNPTAVEKGK